MDIEESLELLNFYLRKKSIKRSFVICGGASLILQKITNRPTKDIDVVAPQIDSELKEAALHVADDLDLSDDWLNSGPGAILNDLEPGWKDRIIEVFRDSHLTVYSISRKDIIMTKLWAMCDRDKDIEDLIKLNPTKNELNLASARVKLLDGNPSWEEWVDSNVQKLFKELGHE